MEKLHNGFTLELCPGAFPLSTDSVALSDFVRLSKNATVLDLGAGCGTLGLMLCAKDANCHVTGIEIRQEDHETALFNAAQNNISDRLESICADLASVPSLLKPGSYSCCISNPPYFSGGFQSEKTPLARRDDLCPPEVLMRSAAWALKYGGDFFLVHKPEKLAELCAAGNKHGLEAKRLLLLRHRPGSPVALILLQLRKGAKPGLIWEEEILFHEDGSPTDYYRTLYHM